MKKTKKRQSIILDKMKLRFNGKWKEYDIELRRLNEGDTLELTWTFVFDVENFWLKLIEEEATKKTITSKPTVKSRQTFKV